MDMKDFTVHSTFHTTNKKLPGKLVFGWDMTLPITYVVDWKSISQYEQALPDKNNE